MKQASTLRTDDDTAHQRQITRQLHQALRELGHEPPLQRIACEIPDARDRLAQVCRLTEAATHQVLGLIEAARPASHHMSEQGQRCQRDIDLLLADSGCTEAQLRDGLRRARHFVAATVGHVHQQDRMHDEIRLSQSFQDLSGQVMLQLNDIVSRTEDQLLHLLPDSAPQQMVAALEKARGQQLQGPQGPGKALQQDDVDTLLAQMGF